LTLALPKSNGGLLQGTLTVRQGLSLWQEVAMKSVRVFAGVTLTALAITAAASAARAELLIKVDQSIQRMTVDLDGQRLHEWPVSTGRPGFETPRGNFRPNRMVADHYSDEYEQAPMPHAIFFDLKGHAIHGTFEPIGKPAASHGCVRLAPANAARLFSLVKQQKMANTKVEISGDVMVALRNMKPTKTAKTTTRQRRAAPDYYDQAEVAQPYYGDVFIRERSSQDALYGLY
jgi:hypothetical protein